MKCKNESKQSTAINTLIKIERNLKFDEEVTYFVLLHATMHC